MCSGVGGRHTTHAFVCLFFFFFKDKIVISWVVINYMAID